jgi:hypothetical protein
MIKKLRLRISLTMFILLTFCYATTVMAQVSITQPGIPFAQDFENFDGLADPVNWVTSDAPGAATSNWLGQGNGSSNSGGKWSYGLDADPDRSFGFLASSTRAIYADIAFTNNTGETITSLGIAYAGEHWRSTLDGKLNGWAVSFKIGDGSFIDVPQLTYVAPNNKPSGALNGNLPENREVFNSTVSDLMILPATTFTIRFFGDNGTGPGARQGVAFDDFSLTVSTDAPTQVAAPTFNPPAGTYYSPQNIEITTITENADVFYSTLSDTGPWTPYTVAVMLDQTTTLWAYASKTGLSNSDVSSAEYIFPVPATTALPYAEDFETDLGDMYTFSVSGNTKFWNQNSGNETAQMNGFNSGDLEEDWLILPGINMDNYAAVAMNFETWRRYGTSDANNYLKLFYSVNYAGVGDPSSATWTELSFTHPDTEQVWTPSGNIDLSGVTGSMVYIGFKYHYSAGNYVWWQVDNILIEEIIYDVTFNVDMTDVVPFNPLTDVVYLAGSFPGAFWNEPGTNPNLMMAPESPGSLIYTITLSLPPGYYEYKYFRNAGWGGGEWGGGPNRNVTIDNDAVINDVWGIIVADHDVTFNVDMTGATGFDPLFDLIYLAGSFPGANWNEPGTNPDMLMQPQAPGSMIYTLTLQLPNGTFDYKYFKNAGWGGGEWGEGPNRSVVVAGDLTVNDVWGVPGGPVAINWANLQWPPDGIINLNEIFMVYAQLYIPGITGSGMAQPDINGWFGFSTTDATTSADFESGWTWIPAIYNTNNGANDEYQLNLGNEIITPGTYYYVSRFQYDGGDYVYGGFNSGFWDGITNVSGILNVLDAPTSENILIIKDAAGFPGVPVTIDIEIENDDLFTGFQVDIPLPAGFNYVANSVQLNAVRENGHLIDAQVLAGDVLRILSYHPSSLPFLGNDGIIASFELNTPAFAGNHMLLAVDPIIGDALGANILTSSVNGELTLLSGGNIAQINDLVIDIGQDATIELEIINSDAFTGFQMDILLPAGMTYEPGSIALTSRAGNHEISATMLAGNILRVLSWSMNNALFTGNDGPVATFILDYGTALPDDYPLVLDDAIIGDVNGNNIVTMMNDGVLTLNIVLENIMEIVDAEGLANLPETIELAITNNLPFTGFQLDVLLPAGFSYIDGTIALDPLRAANHEIAATMIDNNTLRILCFSSTNALFSGNEGTVATFDLMLSPAPGTYTLVIDNAIIGNVLGQNILTSTLDGEIEVLPSTSCPEDFEVCIDAEPFALTGGEPEGGIYAGPGVENGIFNPSVAGAGAHEITYSYTFPNDVTGVCSFFITVNELPVVTCPDSFIICEDEAPFTLTGGTPLGGVYSGPGVENGIFDPSVAGLGDHVITYTYVDDNTCINSCEYTITVAPILEVSVSIAAESTIVCDGNAAILTATPVNGGSSPVFIWYVNCMQMPGNDATFTYFPLNGDVVTCELFSSEQCNDGPAMSNAVAITVNPWVEVSIIIESDLNEVCYGTTVVFSVAQVQNPGSDPHYQWQVNGENVGENATTYSYIPSDGDEVHCILISSEPCTFDNPVISNAITMVIYPIPVVVWEWEYDTVCINWGPLPLFGAEPEGGVYSGPGVEDAYFSPSAAGLGEHVLTYTYTSEEGCTNFATINIFVDGCVGMEEVFNTNSFSLHPNPASDKLIITLNNSNTRSVQIVVFDSRGNVVKQLDQDLSGNQHVLNISTLQPGIYMLQLRGENGLATRKFIVM